MSHSRGKLIIIVVEGIHLSQLRWCFLVKLRFLSLQTTTGGTCSWPLQVVSILLRVRISVIAHARCCRQLAARGGNYSVFSPTSGSVSFVVLNSVSAPTKQGKGNICSAEMGALMWQTDSDLVKTHIWTRERQSLPWCDGRSWMSRILIQTHTGY